MWITLRTLAVAAIGAAAAYALAIPAPFLTGPALFVTLSALMGLHADIPAHLRNACFLLIGANMGTSVTPETLATAVHWPGSLVILSISILVIFLLGARLLRALFRMDRMTSLLSATPGHLSFVISLSMGVHADLPRVTLIQSLRVLALTLLVPFIAPMLSDHPLPSMRPIASVMPMAPMAIIVVLSFGLGLVFQRLRLPAALLLGGMAVSSFAHALSLTEGTMPRWISLPCFVTMGALIGTRFTGVTPRMLAQAAAATGVLTGFAALTSLAAAVAVSYLFGLPLVTALIAMAPGGLETMIAMSVLMDANPAYVAAHHVFRLVLLTFVLPYVVARARRAQASTPAL